MNPDPSSPPLSYSGPMRCGLLGSVEVVDGDGRIVELGGRQPRVVLGLLLLARGRAVTADALVDAIWGERPPSSAQGTVQSYVSRLRRALERCGMTLRLDEVGYVLDRGGAQLDVVRFEELADEGRRRLDRGDPAGALEVLTAADALWRGPALGELRDLPAVAAIAAGLEERRVVAREDRLAAELALGRHELVIGELAALAATHPLREGVHAKHAIALYRSGRQAEAVRALAAAASVLRDELGIEPSRSLRDLEVAILGQDPALDLPAGAPDHRSADGEVASAAPGQLSDRAAHRKPDHVAVRALAGRGDELASLVGAWRASLAGSGRFVVVEGEPGIGKTHLVEVLCDVARAEGGRVVWGRCDEGGAAPALWPWLDPLRELARHVAVADELLALLDGGPVADAGATGGRRLGLLSELAAILDRAADDRPTLLVIDDLQWADATSLDLLALLATRPGTRWTVAITLRELEVGRNDGLVAALASVARRPGTERVRLRGLAPDDTVELLAAAAGVDRPTALAIHRRAEGSPFYAIELARLGPDADAAVPAGLGDVVRRRIARLPAPTIELLGVAAVCGREVELDLLARCAELDLGAVLDHLDPAVAHRLLVVDDDRPTVVRFHHALVREVVHDGLTALRRARLHLRVADAMEVGGEVGVDQVEIQAEHLWRAAPAGAALRAADALERAAEVALRRLAYRAAETHLRRALQLRRGAAATSDEELRRQLRTLARLLEVIVSTRYYQGAEPELLTLGRDLAHRLGAHDVLRQLLYYETSALLTSCRLDEVAALVDELRALTERDERPAVQASGLEKVAVLAWGRGQLVEASDAIDRSVAQHAMAAPPPGDQLAAEHRNVAHMFRLMIHGLRGDVPAAEVVQGFVAAIDAAPDRSAAAAVCGFAATTAATLGRWDDVAWFCQRAANDEHGDQFAFWHGQLAMLGGVLAAADRDVDIDRAVERFHAGRQAYEAVGARSSTPTALASLAINLARRGAVDRAEEAARAAHHELARFGERWNEPTVVAADAAIAAARGDLDAAAGLVDRAMVIAADQGALGVVARLQALRAELGIGLGVGLDMESEVGQRP